MDGQSVLNSDPPPQNPSLQYSVNGTQHSDGPVDKSRTEVDSTVMKQWHHFVKNLQKFSSPNELTEIEVTRVRNLLKQCHEDGRAY